MKPSIALVAVALLTGCVSVDPSVFADRCTLEGHGQETLHHELCKNYYARAYNAQRRSEIARALADYNRRTQEENETVECSVFGNQMTCSKF